MTRKTSARTHIRTRRPTKVTAALILNQFVLSPTADDAIDRVKMLIPSRDTLRQVVRKLRDAQKQEEASALERYCRDDVGFDPDAPPQRSKGQPVPIVGQSKTYDVQANKIGSPFVRISVKALGVGKGDQVDADYEDGQILVRKSANPPRTTRTNEP